MKVLIVEDENLAAQRLEKMIHHFDASIQVIDVLESVEESVEWFKNNPEPELIFLDIHLEDDLSFAIFENVSIKAPVIFTTAFDEYAIKAFKLRSIDYLLKPVVQEELNKAIQKYKEWNANAHAPVDMRSLYELVSKRDPVYKERFLITVGQKIKTVGIDAVNYFYSDEGMTFMVLQNKTEYPIDYSLDALVNELNPKDFFRINRKFIVRLSALANVHVYPKSRLKVVLTPPYTEDVFVSLEKVTAFKKWLNM